MAKKVEGMVEGKTKMPSTDMDPIFKARWERLFSFFNLDPWANYADKQLAKVLGKSPNAVQYAKHSQSIPGLWLYELCEKFSISLDWLILGVGNPPGVVEDQDVPCDISCFGPQFVELAELIELVETRMQAAKRNLPPKRKAKAIVAAYKLWMQDKDLAIEALESFFPAIEED